MNRYNTVQLALQAVIAVVLVMAATDTVPFTALVIAIALSQALAVVEVAGAARGKTGSTLAASITQVGARIGIAALLFLFLPFGPHWMIALLGIAWAGADALRYLYYLNKANPALAWARYHGFIVLYPLGMTLENVIVWKVMQHFLEAPLWFFLPFLAIYAPLAVQMYRYMLGQRRRFLARRAAVH
ncbi:MAG: protein tyrosine phosphatase-like domain-containing protein [Alcanivoracaceae bacterium]|nr:protein tyrosine phosphatase-like domain-containing protein [Alcanivoracaceae bacterium]